MSHYNLSGPPKVRRLDGVVITLPYALIDNFMAASFRSESEYRDMADSSKKRAGSSYMRPTFRFELGGMTPEEASDLAFVLEQGEFYFTPRTSIGADTGTEVEYRVRVTGAIKLSEKVHLQGDDAISMKIELEGIEAVQVIEAAPAMYFVGEDDDHFYTLSSDFTQEIDTGLDLTSESIDAIDLHQASSTVYGLNKSTGAIYSWSTDGSGLALFKATGFTDLEGLVVDNDNDLVIVSTHVPTSFNPRVIGYDLAGTEAFNYFNHWGTHSIAIGPHDAEQIAGVSYVIFLDAPFPTSRVRISDGLVQRLQDTVGGSWADGVVIPDLTIGYLVGNGAIYVCDIVTLANTTPISTVVGSAALHVNASSVDYFALGASYYVVGCGGGKIWSWQVGAGTVTLNRSAANARCLCTLKP